ncbi:alpha/beta hydrolase-fold protein [Chryseobacterium oranimense]|uniref:alpha/beta hydrolase n=1 Tax=Chryseobacterium oranimense TaxID=421058 RepID=UPI0021AE53F8|nr:alpha/beta hydrolase-fold protein [Chryseobacterium oranimense]UWX60532.1 alpha/beta hydrolase-fold protein [Chryseobacterium oranimense]
MFKKILLLMFAFLSILASAQLPKVVSGKIERVEDFKSQYISPQNVDIWLPEGYSKDKKYSVLYMHDGQMLYDPEVTWNKQAWNVDDVITELLRKGKIKNVIVVGIWNDGKLRHSDYFPQKPFENLTSVQKDTIRNQLKKTGRSEIEFNPNSDNYLKFLVRELKPYIDENYSVYKDRKHTFIAGSSMGALISLYAICEYPEIFGGAACMSTHWPGIFTLENNPFPDAMLNYLKNNVPDPRNHKIYFDVGDKTLDALYPPLQKKANTILINAGFSEQNFKTLFFPGEDHSEKAWNKRLFHPLEFLLKK